MVKFSYLEVEVEVERWYLSSRSNRSWLFTVRKCQDVNIPIPLKQHITVLDFTQVSQNDDLKFKAASDGDINPRMSGLRMSECVGPGCWDCRQITSVAVNVTSLPRLMQTKHIAASPLIKRHQSQADISGKTRQIDRRQSDAQTHGLLLFSWLRAVFA